MSLVMDAPLRGEMVDVGAGRRMHRVCEGPARGDGPTVLFEAGSFGFSADWAEVQDQLARKGIRSCAYDRAGLGASDPGPQPRDGLAIAKDLENLLSAAQERGPFILVGHSMAGLHVRLFAARNPRQVAGVVLVDATTPEEADEPTARNFILRFLDLSRFAAWGAKVGLLRPLAGVRFADAIGLEGEPAEEKRRAFASPGHNRWSAAEAAEWFNDARQAEEAGEFDPAWPVAVVRPGPGPQPGGRRTHQNVPAVVSRQGFVEYVPGANHASLLGPRYADRIVSAILRVRAAALNASAVG
ncbi:MAG: alpha/beta hydrolase [Caulobacterales bacterium]